MEVDGDGPSADRRRRERRMRSWFRHEQHSVLMALLTAAHHSFDRAHVENGAPRSQSTATRARGGRERHEQKYTAKFRKTPPPQPELFQLYEEEPGGSRPPCLGEPRGPQERGLRRTVEQMADVCPFVQILDASVPRIGDQLLEVFRLLDTVLPVQVIDVPKISQDSIPQQLVDCDLRDPHIVKQLVEVPTVLSLDLLQKQVVEQIVDNPVPRGRDGHGGLQGFSPRTEFNSVGS